MCEELGVEQIGHFYRKKTVIIYIVSMMQFAVPGIRSE